MLTGACKLQIPTVLTDKHVVNCLDIGKGLCRVEERLWALGPDSTPHPRSYHRVSREILIYILHNFVFIRFSCSFMTPSYILPSCIRSAHFFAKCDL